MERLKQLRVEKGLLQKEAAQKIGVDRTTYVKYERGTSEPNLETLQYIADLFEVSVDYLLGRDGQKERPTPMSGDGQAEKAQIFMDLVDDLTDEQKQLLLVQLQAWKEQNQKQALVAPPSDKGKYPKSDF